MNNFKCNELLQTNEGCYTIHQLFLMSYLQAGLVKSGESWDKSRSGIAGGQARGEQAQQVENPNHQARQKDQGSIMEHQAINTVAEVTIKNVKP